MRLIQDNAPTQVRRSPRVRLMSVFGHTFEIIPCFNEDGQVDQGAYALVGNDTQCMGLTGTCFVEIFVPSVAVYPSF